MSNERPGTNKRVLPPLVKDINDYSQNEIIKLAKSAGVSVGELEAHFRNLASKKRIEEAKLRAKGIGDEIRPESKTIHPAHQVIERFLSEFSILKEIDFWQHGKSSRESTRFEHRLFQVFLNTLRSGIERKEDYSRLVRQAAQELRIESSKVNFQDNYEQTHFNKKSFALRNIFIGLEEFIWYKNNFQKFKENKLSEADAKKFRDLIKDATLMSAKEKVSYSVLVRSFNHFPQAYLSYQINLEGVYKRNAHNTLGSTENFTATGGGGAQLGYSSVGRRPRRSPGVGDKDN